MRMTLTKAGRYQIESELGRGSMGVVYKGFDPIIGRTVAIKTMLTETLPTAEFEEYKARFQREAQAAGILTHPNIVTVYDFGEDDGVLYLAMEFLEGESLQHLVEKQGVLPVETVIPMYEQVCSALDVAHARKIVHRDVKPANIMILESGLVKMTDFGIAKVMHTGMTQAGQIVGTPNYMSPEQVKGRSVDGRSDIFSLGVILYELVTGEKPFGGQNITTVIYKIMNENPIPPRELDPTLHLGLSYVIQKALAKNPDERYQACRELADDLRNYRALGGHQAPSETVAIRVPPMQGMATETVLLTSFSRPAAPYPSPRPPAGQGPAPPRINVPQPPRIDAQPSAPSMYSASEGPAVEIPWPTEHSVPRPTPQAEPAAAAIGATPLAPARPSVAPPARAIEKLKPVSPIAPPIISAPQSARSSAAVWGIVILIILGGLAGGGYYFYKLKRTAQVVVNPSTVTTASAPAVNTATETAASGTTSATTGTTSAPPDIAVSATTRDTGQTQPGATSTTTNQPGATTTPATVPTTPTEVTETPESPLGRLSVDSDPSGAKISLDDKTNPNWVTPYTFNDVPEGPHRVSISRDGFTTVTRTAKVRAGHPQPLVVNLDPVKVEPVPKNPAPAVTAGAGSGVLQIVSTPPGAIISIDGKQVGASPVNQTVSSGPHTYRAELPGTVPYEATVVVEDGGIYPIRVRWGGAVSAPGTLEISTSPAGASVSIDGIGRGATPANIKLQAGTHHLAIEMAGYQTISEDITVSNNQTIQVNRTLSPR